MADTSIYNIVSALSAKYSVCIYMISVAVTIYSGKVMNSSQILLKAPSAKASDGVFADLARESRVAAKLRGINKIVSLE